ncbi:hypothetical protein M0R45_006587 [Rubus argutus]|uniref:Uncharacterized protein n=1 Tax=Rubus argutus TaxID=59490 RepID=A0AAW1YRJ1_RUBAR
MLAVAALRCGIAELGGLDRRHDLGSTAAWALSKVAASIAMKAGGEADFGFEVELRLMLVNKARGKADWRCGLFADGDGLVDVARVLSAKLNWWYVRNGAVFRLGFIAEEVRAGNLAVM